MKNLKTFLSVSLLLLSTLLYPFGTTHSKTLDDEGPTTFMIDPGGPNYDWTYLDTTYHNNVTVNTADEIFARIGVSVAMGYAMRYIPGFGYRNVSLWGGASIHSIVHTFSSFPFRSGTDYWAVTREYYTITPQNETIVMLETAVYSDPLRQNLMFQEWSYLK